jgi:hypothetical protein
MSAFKYKKVKDYKVEVRTKNNVSIASIERDVDGYFYFWMDESINGAWTSNTLREIANKLDELNKEWDTTIKREFSGEK